MIALLSVECEVLQLLLVLAVIEDSLRQHYILVNFGVEVAECGPLARVNLHDIEHHFVLEGLLGVLDVPHAHLLEELSLARLEICDLLLGVHSDVADGGAPLVKVTSLLGDAVLLPLIDVCILDLGLSLPVLLEMLLAQSLHLLRILLLLLKVGVVDLATHYCFIAER